MDSRVRASPEQLSTLLEYMETHCDLARPLIGAQGRVRSDRLWTDLTNILNSVGGGVTKTTEKWKKVWADWKSKTKKKGLVISQHSRGTGGGPASRQTLSAMDERVLAIIGALAVEGQASVEEIGFTRSQSPAQEDSLILQIVLRRNFTPAFTRRTTTIHFTASATSIFHHIHPHTHSPSFPGGPSIPSCPGSASPTGPSSTHYSEAAAPTCYSPVSQASGAANIAGGGRP